MKRLLLKFFLLASLLASVLFLSNCKKSSGGGNSPAGSYYVKFKLDGTQINLTGDAEGNCNVVDAGGKYDCTLAGLKDEFVSDHNTLTVIASNTASLVTNVTYTNFATTTAGQVRASAAYVSYFDEGGIFFSAWGDDFSSTGVISDTKIIFTSITSSSLKGNFSGTMYKSIDGAAPKHVVTNGEFYVKRVN